ncbi:MAG: hypothetical protein KTR24_12440, partial [Saprospiraceae bacterium]|nr:hypothetical protein [Saprospiraceae bacterium]
MKNYQELEDKGWQSMQEILDREMPRKKRRLIYWWIFGSVALGCLVAFMLMGNPVLLSLGEKATIDGGTKMAIPENMSVPAETGAANGTPVEQEASDDEFPNKPIVDKKGRGLLPSITVTGNSEPEQTIDVADFSALRRGSEKKKDQLPPYDQEVSKVHGVSSNAAMGEGDGQVDRPVDDESASEKNRAPQDPLESLPRVTREVALLGPIEGVSTQVLEVAERPFDVSRTVSVKSEQRWAFHPTATAG